MSDYKKNIDQTGVDPKILELQGKSDSFRAKKSGTGKNNTSIPEFVPQYKNSSVDRVIENQDKGVNSFIVLGKDRPAGLNTGYGGKGHTQASAIDIVVGRYSAIPMGVEIDLGNSPKPTKYPAVDPDFTYDAARIYISQKADIDEYFGLTAGKVGNSLGKSAIALKADGVRIIAREGVKIISSGADSLNSQGGDATAAVGVDLIAGNDQDSDKLEPMVLGNKLVEFLNSGVIDSIQDLSDIIYKFMIQQIEYNIVLATHTHYSPFLGKKTSFSPSLAKASVKSIFNNFQSVTNTLKTKINSETGKIEMSYLSPNGILSKYHHLN